MKYIFRRVTESRFETESYDWKLVISPEENLNENNELIHGSVLDSIHNKWFGAYSYKYFSDPHKINSRKVPRNIESLILHPINISYEFIKNILFYLREGKTIYINRNGGYCSDDGFKILEEIEKDELIFPNIYDKHISEKIIISRFVGCKHYYLRSTERMVLEQLKYDSLRQAKEAALKYTTEANIIIKDDVFVYQKQGD